MTLADRVLDWPFVRRNNTLRAFLMASWLGWQIESNWADPFLFAIYSVARPVAGVMILVLMYSVITGGQTGKPIFAYIYLGNALYIMVGMVITGVSWVIIDDREHYRVAKQLHTTPINHFAYLWGRGVARMLIGSVSVLITIGFGIIVFKLPISLSVIDWPLLAIALPLGIIALGSMGAMLGSVSMQMARHNFQLGDAVSAALYLFSGAIFPLDVLPFWLRPLGFIFPVTYWLELMRRALLGPGQIGFPTLASYHTIDLLGILAAFTLAFFVASIYVYRWALRSAKEQGILDLESGY